VLVTNIVEGGSAEDAKMKENDVIIRFDNVAVNTVPELQEQVGKHRPGDKATVTYIRNGKESTASLILKNVEGNTNVVKTAAGSELLFGAKLMAISSSDKKSYNIDSGVKVVELRDGKFRDIGMSKGYIITSINGKKVRQPSDIKQFTNDESFLKSIGGIQPDGTILNYQFGN
jgi:S1-C subfamily serine protease